MMVDIILNCSYKVRHAILRYIYIFFALYWIMHSTSLYASSFEAISPNETVKKLYALKSQKQIELMELNSKVLNYTMQHKLVTACLVATGASVAIFIRNDPNLSERTKGLMEGITTSCVIILALNASEVIDVTETLMQFGIQYNNLVNEINMIDDQIARLEEQLGR